MWKALPHGSIHQNSSGNNPLKRNQEWNAASLNTHLSWWGTCSIKFWNCKKLNSSSSARVQNLMKDQLLLLFSRKKSRVFLLRQIWICKYSVKYSTVDCKYLQDFFFRLKPKLYKKCQYCRLFKKISGSS